MSQERVDHLRQRLRAAQPLSFLQSSEASEDPQLEAQRLGEQLSSEGEEISSSEKQALKGGTL